MLMVKQSMSKWAFAAAGRPLKNITMQKMHIMRQPTVWLWPRPKDTVSLQRAGLGATQNALQHTINYLENSAINLSDAQSRIEDCDIAEEMMNFTKANLMSQVAAAMLAQANSEPNTVLMLLNSLPKANAF